MKKEWINPETAAKISFASGKNASERLLELVDPDQLEVKYGGTVPNLTEFWYFFYYNQFNIRKGLPKHILKPKNLY